LSPIEFHEIIINVIANLLAALIIAFLGVGTYVLVLITERKKLFRFFGINSQQPNLGIYLSRLQIKPHGTIGAEPLNAGYSGPSVTKIEYEGGSLLRDALNSNILFLLPKRLQGWLSQQHASLIVVNPSIEISPEDLGTPPFDNMVSDNMIILGGGIYNRLAKRYLEHSSCQFYFSREEDGKRIIRIKNGGMKDVEIPGRASNRELGIIQKIRDEKHGNTVFLCAGLGSSATFGCARFLAENWRQLQRRYKDEEFGICLGFPDQSPDDESVVQPIHIYP